MDFMSQQEISVEECRDRSRVVLLLIAYLRNIWHIFDTRETENLVLLLEKKSYINKKDASY